jgi:hypothetical protein
MQFLVHFVTGSLILSEKFIGLIFASRCGFVFVEIVPHQKLIVGELNIKARAVLTH